MQHVQTSRQKFEVCQHLGDIGSH